MDINLTGPEFQRLANNFYNANNLPSDFQRINVDANLVNYFLSHTEDIKKKYKVAFLWICLNPAYWQFARPMIDGARGLFLPGHSVDYFLWSDMPEKKEDIKGKFIEVAKPTIDSILAKGEAGKAEYEQGMKDIENVSQQVFEIRSLPNVTVFPTEAIEWPMPTLMRYHTFLQQEEKLKDYDYIFYCDVDMAFVNVVGDEILGPGLTATMNPMYALSANMYPPYEPNPASSAYIKRPGQLVDEPNSGSEIKKRFQPQYYAGGFQGGKADQFITAMKAMRKTIDEDFARNYIAIWNEESHWNKYLFDHPENLLVLNQSYLYPDSLHQEYYIPRWGRDYQPKLVTLTKKFSLRPLSPQEQAQLNMMQKK